METSQKPLLLHDDVEAQTLIERIKQMKIEEQNRRENSSEVENLDQPRSRYLFSQNLC
jgi:hypothetical protein